MERLAWYTNGRYGFSGAYPASWLVGPESDNGDGARISDGQGATVSYWGSNYSEISADERMASALQQYPGSTLSVKRSNETSLVLSGIDSSGEKVFYYREWIGTGSMNAMLWEYPVARKKGIDPFVSDAAHGFRPGELELSH